MKKFLILMIIIFLGSTTILTYAAQSPNYDDQRIYYSSPDGNIEQVNVNNKEKNIVYNKSGTSSPSGKQIVYLKTDGRFTSPIIYIDSLDSLSTREIPIDERGTDLKILSWSPDEKYVLLFDRQQYLGGSEIYIYNIQSGKETTKLNVLTSRIAWISNDKFIYIDSTPDCPELKGLPEQCNMNTAISSYDLSKGEKQNIQEVENGSRSYSTVDAIEQDPQEVRIAYRTVSPSIDKETNNRSDFMGFAFNLSTSKVRSAQQTEFIYPSLLASLEESNPNLDSVVSLRSIDGDVYVGETYASKDSSAKDIVSFSKSKGINFMTAGENLQYGY